MSAAKRLKTVDVAAVLAKRQAEEAALHALVNVDRPEEHTVDLGNLLTLDPRAVDVAEYTADPAAYMKATARENVQLLVNALWKEPVIPNDEGLVLVALPAPTTVIPREKPLPVEKQKTRWEKFADIKGIQKRKKSRMVFDEESGEYKPRWGYKGINQEMDDPIIELPDQADPYEDQFEKRAAARSQRIAKNKSQQLRNLREARQVIEKKQWKNPAEKEAVKSQLVNAFAITKTSTASAGKFDEKLKAEPRLSRRGQKANLPHVVQDAAAERQRSLALLNKVHSKMVTINTKAGAVAADSEAPGAARASKGRKRPAGGPAKGGKRPRKQ